MLPLPSDGSGGGARQISQWLSAALDSGERCTFALPCPVEDPPLMLLFRGVCAHLHCLVPLKARLS